MSYVLNKDIDTSQILTSISKFFRLYH